MQTDEQAIRALLDTWFAATKAGDHETVLKLMSDDVVFMVPGQEPFGKDAFAAASKSMRSVRLEGRSEIKELKILGDWAWMRCKLNISVTPPDRATITRSGYTLTILNKNPKGAWVITRDANLLTNGAGRA